MNFHVTEVPFSGSDITSKVLDTRDAFDCSLSWYTTGASASTFTYQISNFSGRNDQSIPEASWSNWTVVVVSSASLMQPPLGARWARILRGSDDTAKLVFNWNKQVR